MAGRVSEEEEVGAHRHVVAVWWTDHKTRDRELQCWVRVGENDRQAAKK